MILCDMGCKKEGICTDLTRTYPINGKFSKRQKEIYQIVFDAQKVAIDGLKPGVLYGDLQTQAYKAILQGLKDLNILNGSVDIMYKNDVHKTFMFHRLGHFIGFLTHDVGPKNTNTIEKAFKSVEECIMEEGMTLTIEPGIYFNDVKIKIAKDDEILSNIYNFDIIKQYRDEIGGIRIEDDFVVTKDGNLNLTKSAPKTIEEIEKCMAKKSL